MWFRGQSYTRIDSTVDLVDERKQFILKKVKKLKLRSNYVFEIFTALISTWRWFQQRAWVMNPLPIFNIIDIII